MTTTTYRYKQPPTVQAWQWIGGDITNFPTKQFPGVTLERHDDGIDVWYQIHTDHFRSYGHKDYDAIDPGNWVVRNEKGLVRSYTDAEFRATFEPAPSHSGEAMGHNGDSVPLEVVE